VRKNEISVRKWFGGTAQLRTLEGTLAVIITDFNDRNQWISESVELASRNVLSVLEQSRATFI